MEQRVTEERRQHPRLHTKRHKSFVLIPEDTKLGEIIDISMGGIAFQYVGDEMWSEAPLQIGTLFGEGDLWLENLSLKVVSDTVLESPYYLGYPALRRRSMQFCDLNETEISMLEQFITLNTEEDLLSMEQSFITS